MSDIYIFCEGNGIILAVYFKDIKYTSIWFSSSHYWFNSHADIFLLQEEQGNDKWIIIILLMYKMHWINQYLLGLLSDWILLLVVLFN